MNFELGEIKSSSRAAAVFNRSGASNNSGSQSINFPNHVRIDNRFLDDGDKLHSDLVGLSVATATRQRVIPDIFEEDAAASEKPEEEIEPHMEVEDLENLGEQEVFSMVARKPNEVSKYYSTVQWCSVGKWNGGFPSPHLHFFWAS